MSDTHDDRTISMSEPLHDSKWNVFTALDAFSLGSPMLLCRGKMMENLRLIRLMMVACLASCGRETEKKTEPPPVPNAVAPTVAVSSAKPAHVEPVRIETVPVAGDLPVFVLRGATAARRMVFLHGHCSHALGFLQSFPHAAARHGTIVAVQADKACADENYREWTDTPERLDRRIEAAFRTLGSSDSLDGLAILGYSSGAVLAEMLAHRSPKRYSNVVLIGGPQKPVEWRLRRTRSTAMVAGERDRQDLMQMGARELQLSGIPSKFFILPGAKHGQMGPQAEAVMEQVLTWLWDNEREI